MDLVGPIVRVLLHQYGAYLMTHAGLTLDPNDPDLGTIAEGLAGLLISAGTWAVYALARKFGWER